MLDVSAIQMFVVHRSKVSKCSLKSILYSKILVFCVTHDTIHVRDWIKDTFHRSLLATSTCASFISRVANTDDIDRLIYELTAHHCNVIFSCLKAQDRMSLSGHVGHSHGLDLAKHVIRYDCRVCQKDFGSGLEFSKHPCCQVDQVCCVKLGIKGITFLGQHFLVD